MKLRGKLSGEGNYISHRVRASYLQRIIFEAENENAVSWSPAQRIYQTDANGTFTLELPEKEDLSRSLSIDVLAPDGEVLESENYDIETLGQQILIKVDAKTFAGVEEISDEDLEFLSQRVKITGRVIDIAGKQLISNKQVILYGEKSQDGDSPVILLASTTDKNGYFSGDYPRKTYDKAHALVGIGDGQTVPIPILDSGEIPRRIVLPVKITTEDVTPINDKTETCVCDQEVPRAPDKDDLVNSGGTFSNDLGMGGCINFNLPNRTLEEFSYYVVVRTTDPEIKGLTISEPKKIPQHILDTINKNDLMDSKAVMMRRLPNGLDSHADSLPLEVDRKLAGADMQVLSEIARDPDSFTPSKLVEVSRNNKIDLIRNIIEAAVIAEPGRGELNSKNPIKWDRESTFYQATTLAHGHLLHFKQEWKSDGYSLGDLLYSLPLAACQKKQIAVIDWDRRDVAGRTELLEEEERVQAMINRDRDISEIVESTLSESIRGSSQASTGGIGGGVGGSIVGFVGGALAGAVGGLAGGFGSSSSTARSDAARSIASNSLQQIHDKTMQSASALRSQRSTVIQTVEQGESMRVQTEVVANHNHCHAITIEYFQVLRHLIVSHRLADVQECLFIPLLMSRFDSDKALRWRNILMRFLLDRSLVKAFASVERIKIYGNNYEGSGLPNGRYSEEAIESLDGELRLQMSIARPKDKEDGTFDEISWRVLVDMGLLWTTPFAIFNQYLTGRIEAEKDRIFRREVAPRIAERFVKKLNFWVTDSTNGTGMTRIRLDPTLISKYVEDGEHYVSLRSSGTVPVVNRENIKNFIITVTHPLSVDSKVTVKSAAVRYRTRHMNHFLFRDAQVLNDLSVSDSVVIPTPLDQLELRNPKEEDKELQRRLLSHLNENLEYCHKAMWQYMDKDHRYMLLDGFYVSTPDGHKKSVASAVENRLIGIVGNSLVMPVSPGFRLDSTAIDVKGNPLDLKKLYISKETIIDPRRLTLPTKGVFAESVMGSCNSCEEKDDSRFWRFEESPCGDEPTMIQPVSTESRAVATPDLKPTPLPAPIINLQNAPSLPDPTGLAESLSLLANANLFRDLSGLDQNQRNAMAAMASSLEAAKHFGSESSQLVKSYMSYLQQKAATENSDKIMKTINSEEAAGHIDKDTAAKLRKEAINSMMGKEQPSESKSVLEQPEVREAIRSAAMTPGGELKLTRSTRDETVGLDTHSGPRAFIVEGPEFTAKNLAFNPRFEDESGKIIPEDKSGKIKLSVSVPKNMPPGGSIRWSLPPNPPFSFPGSIIFSPISGTSNTVRFGEQVEILAMRPGELLIDVEVRDKNGRTVESSKYTLSVPQFVVVEEDPVQFDNWLQSVHISGGKNDVVQSAREVCEYLLETSNVRIVWRVGGSPDSIPAHLIGSDLLTHVTLGDEPPLKLGPRPVTRTTMGVCNTAMVGSVPDCGPKIYNESIQIYPGAFDNEEPNPLPGHVNATEVDLETVAIILHIENTPFNTALKDFAKMVFGRLIGQTISHEIIHCLLGGEHNPLPNEPDHFHDIRSRGGLITFRERTGLQDIVRSSPVLVSNFKDHGVSAILRMPKDEKDVDNIKDNPNQTLINMLYPVPPAFKLEIK